MEFEQKVTIAAIATITSGVISSAISFIISRLTQRKHEEKALEDLLLQINKITIEYPYLEDEQFISQYNPENSTKEEYLRYDAYCIIVFNFLERTAKHYKFNISKIKCFVHYEEMIELHEAWWSASGNFKENIRGYDKRFVSLVNETIAK